METEPLDEIEPDQSDDESRQSDVIMADPDHTPPRMPRPYSIRQVSGPSLTFGADSGSTRKRLPDDADYSDPDTRATQRLRLT